jgi:MYXO-CTERM domain-containing protein
VIGQNPNAGTAVAPGSTVDIEVSLGASVPDVVGLGAANAGAAIVGAGLVVGTVTTANSNTVPIGDVISQTPGAGTNVAPGSAVAIEISLGASVPGPTVPVPDVAGLSQANADAAIVGAGLVVGSVISANSNSVPTGDVISQAPGAGTGVAPGSAVIIVVSLGGASVPVQDVPVPDVEGLNQANAEAAIVGAGLVVGTVTTINSNTVPTGDVTNQNPSAGTDVAPGSAVAIQVSLGVWLAQVTAAGSGCSVGSGNGPADPTLPLLVLISVLFLTRRRWMRAWKA